MVEGDNFERLISSQRLSLVGGVLVALALSRMFIFGGKKKKEKATEVDKELRSIVARIISSHGNGLYQLLARASPDGDVEKIKKMLAHNEAYDGPEVTKETKYRKLFVETKDFQHEIAAAHYPYSTHSWRWCIILGATVHWQRALWEIS